MLNKKCLCIVVVLLVTLCGCAKNEISYDHDKDEALKKEPSKTTYLNSSGEAKEYSYKEIKDYTFEDKGFISISNTSTAFYSSDDFDFFDLRKGSTNITFSVRAFNRCLFKNFVMQLEFFDKNNESLGVFNTKACDFLSDYSRFIIASFPEQASSFKIIKLNCSQLLIDEEKDLEPHTFEDGCSAGEVSMESANYFMQHLSGKGILMLLNKSGCIITSVHVNGSRSSFTSDTFGAESFIYYEQ